MATVHESRKKISESPENDFYQTPKCVTWELINNYLSKEVQDTNVKILDPCCGKYAIGHELSKVGSYHNLTEKDLVYGDDFLKNTDSEKYDLVVMNPPFKDFDDFVNKAKEKVDIICSIGRLNYFGAHQRNVNGLWKNLKYVLVFDRQIAYDREFREDGKVECGMMISCWFIWDKKYEGDPMIKMVDMQKYIVSQKEKTQKQVEELNKFIDLGGNKNAV